MSQDPITLEKVGGSVAEGAGRVEGMLSAFLQSHPQLAEGLASFGTRNDVLTVVMVGLGLSFVILLAALMTMRPRRTGYYPQPAANEQLLFSKYAYEVPGEQGEE